MVADGLADGFEPRSWEDGIYRLSDPNKHKHHRGNKGDRQQNGRLDTCGHNRQAILLNMYFPKKQEKWPEKVHQLSEFPGGSVRSSIKAALFTWYRCTHGLNDGERFCRRDKCQRLRISSVSKVIKQQLKNSDQFQRVWQAGRAADEKWLEVRKQTKKRKRRRK